MRLDPNTVTVKQLQFAVHALASRKGFWDRPRPFATSIALVHSEVSEAHQELRDRRMDAYRREIADIGIRLLDLAESRETVLCLPGEQTDPIDEIQRRRWIGGAQRPRLVQPGEVDRMMLVHRELSRALEADRSTSSDRDLQVNRRLTAAFYHVLRMAEYSAFSLAHEMVAKHEFNETRVDRHGKRY